MVDVTDFGSERGSHNLILFHDGIEVSRSVIQIERPAPPLENPDLVVRNFMINPYPPRKGENCVASFIVQNQGGSGTGIFEVEWQPRAGEAKADAKVRIDNLNPGESRSFSFNHTYNEYGEVQSLAIVDVGSNVSEKDEINNSQTISFFIRDKNKYFSCEIEVWR